MCCKEISVKAIIFINNKLLILFRNNSPILPGGRINDNETLTEALLRELEEELGLSRENFIIKCPVYSTTFKNKVYIYFLVQLKDSSLIKKIRLCEEHDSFYLLDKDSIKKYNWLYDVISKISDSINNPEF